MYIYVVYRIGNILASSPGRIFSNGAVGRKFVFSPSALIEKKRPGDEASSILALAGVLYDGVCLTEWYVAIGSGTL